MKDAKFERQAHTIKDLSTGERKPFKSINQAKKWSRDFQKKEDGGLGLGSLRLAK